MAKNRLKKYLKAKKIKPRIIIHNAKAFLTELWESICKKNDIQNDSQKILIGVVIIIMGLSAFIGQVLDIYSFFPKKTVETSAALTVDGGLYSITVSLQQSCDLVIKRQAANGKTEILDSSEIVWLFSSDNIAQVDGNRILGINAGTTKLTGSYHNQIITLNVKVVERMDGIIDILQKYKEDYYIEPFAGAAERIHSDGSLNEAEFISPESMSVNDDGSIYVSDSGLLRKIADGYVESIQFEPKYLTPNTVRCYLGDTFILTDAWEDEDGYFYGIIRLTENGAEGIYIADARYTSIEDFTFSPDGFIYFIDRNEMAGVVTLKTLNLNDTQNIRALCELPNGTSSLALNEAGAVYLSNPQTGVIHIFQNGGLSFFAGIENNKAFIDGYAPLFYEPWRIKYENNFLYVWDYNVLRRINTENGYAGETITVVGEASPGFDISINKNRMPADNVILPNGKLVDFVIRGTEILITDPKRGLIWKAES